MLFNSFAFAVFLPIVFLAYWALPHKYRGILILAASYYFYMSWNPRYLVLILFTTLVSYGAAIALEKKVTPAAKKRILFAAAGASLGVLFFFKYFNFAAVSLTKALSLISIQLHPLTLRVMLPVGISFYTFQTLSYVIDVYRGDVPAERNFISYAAFISFFPQLVAGPIERTRNLLPQIRGEHSFDYEKAVQGLQLMVWGFFKKLVIADVLAEYVQRVYAWPMNYTGFSLVLATLFFSVQIYCDFSGYSDIAIGTAKLLGIDLMTNFRSPYFAQSVKEFWSRWHISLSTWFRDYVYIPLGGNRVGKLRHSVNLMVTFLVSGLWHGADWKFVIWGGIHGGAQVLENWLFGKKQKPGKGLAAAVRILAVFGFCTVAWVFFVANSLGEARYVLRFALSGIRNLPAYLQKGLLDLGLTGKSLTPILVSLATLGAYDFFSLKHDCMQWLREQNRVVRYGVYLVLLAFILFYRASAEAQFVYFQF